MARTARDIVPMTLGKYIAHGYERPGVSPFNYCSHRLNGRLFRKTKQERNCIAAKKAINGVIVNGIIIWYGSVEDGSDHNDVRNW